MNLIEFFARRGKVRCDCKEISFIVSKKSEIKKRSVFTRKKTRTLLEQVIPYGYKMVKETAWVARCSQCGVLYFTSISKKWLIENFKKNDIKFSIAVNNGEPECKESPCCISLTLNVPEGKKND